MTNTLESEGLSGEFWYVAEAVPIGHFKEDVLKELCSAEHGIRCWRSCSLSIRDRALLRSL